MSRKGLDTAKLQRLQYTLRDAGLRSTTARVQVLHVLEEAYRNGSPPLSHNDVAEALESDMFDRATVYRNLMDLTEAGLASRADMGDHVWRFARMQKDQTHANQHPHFVCRDCGSVSCLPANEVKISASSKRLKQKNLEVQVRGTCAACEINSQ